jgi:hypothetical protein
MCATQAAIEACTSVVVASRTAEKVEAAVAGLGSGVEGEVQDTTDESRVETFFDFRPPFDHVIVSAARTKAAGGA